MQRENLHNLIMQRINRDILTTVALNFCYKAMVVNRQLLVYSLLRRKLVSFNGIFLTKKNYLIKQFYLMYLGYKERNCIINLIIKQLTYTLITVFKIIGKRNYHVLKIMQCFYLVNY